MTYPVGQDCQTETQGYWHHDARNYPYGRVADGIDHFRVVEELHVICNAVPAGGPQPVVVGETDVHGIKKRQIHERHDHDDCRCYKSRRRRWLRYLWL